MRITFLGTAAANAYPEAFCSCQNCQAARRLGGSSLRKRSAALINQDLLIDLGPDIMSACQAHGLSLAQVRYCLQTHPHADHLDASHLLSRSPEYGTRGAARLQFCASPATLQETARLLARDCAPGTLFDPEIGERLNLSLVSIQPFQPLSLGEYTVTAFPASHDPAMGCQLYAVQQGSACLFYGTDTAVLGEEVWDGFHSFSLRFDLVILDHTYGPEQPGGDHLSAHQVIEIAARLRAEGLLKDNGRVIATHIAHEGNPAHPELAEYAARNGYEVAYDGLGVEVGE